MSNKKLFSMKGFPWQASAGEGKEYHNTGRTIRIGFWGLIVGFGTFLLWAAFAPLDEGVPCPGTVSIDTKRKVVEHLHGGTVEAVHVKEGQLVQKEQVLVTFDKKTSKARFDEVHQHYLGMRATESRLNAEVLNSPSITFHEDLTNEPDRELAMRNMQTQSVLFKTRKASLDIMKKQLVNISELVSKGYAPMVQQRELELKIADFKAATASRLAEVQLEVEADAEKTKALAAELSDTEVRAPATGQVVDLQVQTVGAVVQPGQKMMDIVPADESLLIDAKVSPTLIDSVRKGLPVNITFASFAHAPQLVVQGMVLSVSKDVIKEPQVSPVMPGATYYLARIAVTPEGIRSLGKRQMQPGMPVQVVIKTGDRSLLTYLLDPLIKRVRVSMKEE